MKPQLSHHIRAFSTTPNPTASPLFALASLSNSRETQHFNKLSRLSRVEHSPSLKLIQTGEIDQYPLPTRPRPPPPPPSTTSTSTTTTTSTTKLSRKVEDEKALAIGRAVLQNHADTVAALTARLGRVEGEVEGGRRVLEEERGRWEEERGRLRGDLRAAGVVVVGAVGVATGLAMWRFWPEGRGGGVGLEEKVRGGIRRAMPLPAVSGSGSGSAAVGGGGASAVEPALGVPVRIPAATAAVSSVGGVEEVGKSRTWSRWFKGFFWKQE